MQGNRWQSWLTYLAAWPGRSCFRSIRLLGVCCGLAMAQLPCQCLAQEFPKHAFAVKGLGLSYHLRPSKHPQIFPNRLDDRGIWVLNAGAIAGYDRFISKNSISIRVQQGLYSDCAASVGGFTHLGFRANLLATGRHTLLGGIGPTLVYRQDWNRLPGYLDDGFFKRSGQWQYRFFWYAGELEYYYTISNKQQLGLTLVPGLPELLLVGVAYRRFF